jgi:hypothetical protein
MDYHWHSAFIKLNHIDSLTFVASLIGSATLFKILVQVSFCQENLAKHLVNLVALRLAYHGEKVSDELLEAEFSFVSAGRMLTHILQGSDLFLALRLLLS